jgi:hypothetical protein
MDKQRISNYKIPRRGPTGKLEAQTYSTKLFRLRFYIVPGVFIIAVIDQFLQEFVNTDRYSPNGISCGDDGITNTLLVKMTNGNFLNRQHAILSPMPVV